MNIFVLIDLTDDSSDDQDSSDQIQTSRGKIKKQIKKRPKWTTTDDSSDQDSDDLRTSRNKIKKQMKKRQKWTTPILEETAEFFNRFYLHNSAFNAADLRVMKDRLNEKYGFDIDTPSVQTYVHCNSRKNKKMKEILNSMNEGNLEFNE